MCTIVVTVAVIFLLFILVAVPITIVASGIILYRDVVEYITMDPRIDVEIKNEFRFIIAMSTMAFLGSIGFFALIMLFIGA